MVDGVSAKVTTTTAQVPNFSISSKTGAKISQPGTHTVTTTTCNVASNQIDFSNKTTEIYNNKKSAFSNEIWNASKWDWVTNYNTGGYNAQLKQLLVKSQNEACQSFQK